MHEVVDTILKKEMSRKEFLGMIGLGIVSMIGLSSLMKNLGDTFTRPRPSGSLDYGDSMYGGNTDGARPKFSL